MVIEFLSQIGTYKATDILREFCDSLRQEQVFYNYEDGEEGDTYKYNYFSGDTLVATMECLGGDDYEWEFTVDGSKILSEKYVEIVLGIFKKS